MEGEIEMKKIKPIQLLKANQCPECRGKLELVEEETYVAAIDSKGLPIGGQSFVEQRLRCVKCHAEYNCEKKGPCYHIAPVLPPLPVIVEDFNPFYQ